MRIEWSDRFWGMLTDINGRTTTIGSAFTTRRPSNAMTAITANQPFRRHNIP
jgi:hypothetical protein